MIQRRPNRTGAALTTIFGGLTIGVGCIAPLAVIGFWVLVIAALWKYVFGG
jgi:hypothetical protein